MIDFIEMLLKLWKMLETNKFNKNSIVHKIFHIFQLFSYPMGKLFD